MPGLWRVLGRPTFNRVSLASNRSRSNRSTDPIKLTVGPEGRSGVRYIYQYAHFPLKICLKRGSYMASVMDHCKPFVLLVLFSAISAAILWKQAITWTHVDPVQRRIYVALCVCMCVCTGGGEEEGGGGWRGEEEGGGGGGRRRGGG